MNHTKTPIKLTEYSHGAGCGLLGHLVEICEGSQLSTTLYFDRIPIIQAVQKYIEKQAIPGGTQRN